MNEIRLKCCELFPQQLFSLIIFVTFLILLIEIFFRFFHKKKFSNFKFTLSLPRLLSLVMSLPVFYVLGIDGGVRSDSTVIGYEIGRLGVIWRYCQ